MPSPAGQLSTISSAKSVRASDLRRIASMPASATRSTPALTGIIETIGGVPLMIRVIPAAGSTVQVLVRAANGQIDAAVVQLDRDRAD